MYEAFYGLDDNPFRLTPDPRYLFLSANHQEALGHLLFGVSEGNGVVVLTGEIGAGKTTLLRTLINDLDEHTTVAYIFNPALSSVELLQSINADLGLPADSTSKKSLTDDLNRFLLDMINEDFSVLLDNIAVAEITEVFLSGWAADYNDAHAFLTMLESDNPSNQFGFSNQKYDELMDTAAAQTDPKLRQVYLEEAEIKLLSEHPIIPIYFFVNKNMVSPCVRGFEDNVLNYHYSQHQPL